MGLVLLTSAANIVAAIAFDNISGSYETLAYVCGFVGGIVSSAITLLIVQQLEDDGDDDE